MNAVEKVKKLCKERKIPISKLESDLGFSNGYIGQLKKGIFPMDRAQKIAAYLNMPFEYFNSTEQTSFGITTCQECGFTYDADFNEDIAEHNKYHSAWQQAESKFGELYCNHPVREKIKAQNRNICNDLSNTLNKRYNAQIEVLKCLFSRSVEASNFSLSHVGFDEYVAMMLNTTYLKNLDEELRQKLINDFGTKPGIDNGKSYYEIPDKLSGIITSKDARDISKDINSIMNKLSLKEYGPAAYDGEELSEESAALFKEELEIALKRLKLINKEKYNPNKNKK